MEYSRNTNSRKKQKNAMYYIRNFSRLLMGVLFIFSGYVKMVDPYGFSLKIGEIFLSLGMDFMAPTATVFAFLGILAEFVLGWALLLGIQMQLAAWGLLLFMGFFFVLTFWLAYALDIVDWINRMFATNYQIFVVTDCGCFGDFVKLDNQQTFYKNVVFMLFTLLIFVQRKKYKPQKWYYITQWFPVLLVSGFSLFTMFYCLRHEPWHDFRPWKVGNFIAGETYSQAPVVDYVFKYKNNNDQSIKEITMDEMTEISSDSLLMNDFTTNYTYFDRAEKIIVPGINARLSDFTITDIETREDIKNHVITSSDYTFIVFMRDVTTLSETGFAAVNTLIGECNQLGMDYVIVTASLKEEVDKFNAKYNSDMHFYYSDATPLKTAIRNNPGVILIKDGYVLDKWSFRDIPALQEITAKFPKYEVRLNKYKKKIPPKLPNGETLEDHFAEDEIAED
ncbi:MAG: DoxX family protein [Lentimicrobiaceae bacterium]|nr:DoxX family protein [Lentimicrobiaceae bacterium]